MKNLLLYVLTTTLVFSTFSAFPAPVSAQEVKAEKLINKDLVEMSKSGLPETIPKTEDDPNQYYLESRLKQIRNQIYGAERTKEYVGGRYSRYVISAEDFGWINEIQVEPERKSEKGFLVVKMSISISNTLRFEANPADVKRAFDVDKKARGVLFCKIRREESVRDDYFQEEEQTGK
jgi:hypothetical protein